MWIQRQYPLPFKSLRGRPFDFWRIFFNTKSLLPSWNNISLVRAFSTLEEKFHTSARSRHMFYCFHWRKFFPCYFLGRILFPRDHYAGNFFINYSPPPPLTTHFNTSHGRRGYIYKYVGFTTAIFAVMDLGGVSDLILISMYSPSFKSTYLGPSKSKYAWVFSSLDFTKKLSKQKITIWLIDNLLIPVTIFNTLSLEPHLRAGKVFAWSTTSLLTIYENNPEVLLSLEKEENKKSRDEGEYIWARKTNFLFWL